MVALNPNSYHRLGLSLTDTYVFDGIYLILIYAKFLRISIKLCKKHKKRNQK